MDRSLNFSEQRIKNFKDSIADYKRRPKDYAPMFLEPGWIKAIEKLIYDWELMHEWLSDYE